MEVLCKKLTVEYCHTVRKLVVVVHQSTYLEMCFIQKSYALM